MKQLVYDAKQQGYDVRVLTTRKLDAEALDTQLKSPSHSVGGWLKSLIREQRVQTVAGFLMYHPALDKRTLLVAVP